MNSTNLQKYQTRNPLVRALIQRFLRKVTALIRSSSPERVIDLGCGEGIVAHHFFEMGIIGKSNYIGIDKSGASIEYARQLTPGTTFLTGDFYEVEVGYGKSDVVICLEVLEHQPEPQQLLSFIQSKQVKSAVLSVPWEPYFRLGSLMRGKYLASLGNHPEHFQQYTPTAFRRALANHFDSVKIETSFPWIIAMVERGR